MESKIKQLHQMHLRHIARPTFDDISQEEADIKSLSNELCQMFSECHHQIKSIRRNTHRCHGAEAIIAHNLITYLSGRLQEATTSFRQSQSDYLSRKNVKISAYELRLI